jgi:malonyl-CoA O-methyltransferase
MIDKKQIQSNFSRYATQYDTFATIQTEVGKNLLAYCPEGDIEHILDVGCGTGIFTQYLQNRYDAADITAIDLCRDMIDVARQKKGMEGIRYQVADAEALQTMSSFDLIASNACIQWLSRTEAALTSYRDRLTSFGSLVFSAFGPRTFCELADSLSRLLGRTVTISSKIFQDHRMYECYLRCVFHEVTVECQCMEQVYDSLWDLLKTIKYTGVRGIGLGTHSLSRREIAALETIYLATYGRIVATYDVVYCRARKGEG